MKNLTFINFAITAFVMHTYASPANAMPCEFIVNGNISDERITLEKDQIQCLNEDNTSQEPRSLESVRSFRHPLGLVNTIKF